VIGAGVHQATGVARHFEKPAGAVAIDEVPWSVRASKRFLSASAIGTERQIRRVRKGAALTPTSEPERVSRTS
jgi:hypothetical protein